MATFGKTDIGGSSDSNTSAVCYACKFTAPEDGTITKVTWYTRLNVAGNSKVAIYSDDAGDPKNILAVSDEVAVGTVAGWVDFPISLGITSGVKYWFAKMASQSHHYWYDAGDVNQWAGDAGLTYPNFNDPFDVDANQAYEVSVYATYTTGGGGLTIPVAMHHYNRINKIIRG